LLIVLTQRVSVPLLMDPADPRTVMTTPDGQPLSFWFRGGSTLIVDPEAGTVTYSVGKNILSEGRKRRQMAFLRGQLAGQGTAAILRYGLTPHARERQRRQEPFAFAHSRAHERGTY
jgi:hypothetical protein